MGVAAILLASGYGRRYGSNKLLDTWESPSTAGLWRSCPWTGWTGRWW